MNLTAFARETNLFDGNTALDLRGNFPEGIPPLTGPQKKPNTEGPGKDPTKSTEGTVSKNHNGVIPEGTRNTTLSHYAGITLKKYGDTEKARSLFDKKAAKCQPALGQSELETIYTSARNFLHNTVEKQAGYISPSDFNKPLPSFVYLGNDGHLHISAPSLTDLFAKEHPYKVVTGTGDPKLYLYEKGVFRAAIAIEVEKIIADYINAYNPEMLVTGKVSETYKLLFYNGDHHDIEEFNTDEHIICFKNCLYDFINRKRYQHSPKKLFTVQLDADLPAGPENTPVIDKYMSELMRGNPKGEKLIYEFSGIAFSNVKGYRFKKALFMVGRGDSGKTQIKQLVERIVGIGNFNNTDLSTLESNSFAAAGFQLKRLCGSNDMSFMRAPDINKFKQLTGGDYIDAERKFENSYSFRYDGVMWFVGNQLPLFGGDKGNHVYDRIVPLRCDNVIPKERQIKNLCDQMFMERGGYILKALEAAREAVLNNYTYTIPDDSVIALEQYKSDNNELKQFIDEWTLPQDGKYKKDNTTAAVYKAYKHWCAIANAKVCLSKGMFKRELYQQLGMPADSQPHRTNAGIFFPIMLTDDALKETGDFFLC